MPNPVKITGRSSSITNSFINGIIPVIDPSEDEVRQVLDVLGMTPDSFHCAYCGDTATEWDHLRPLVKGKRPTGYISEIHNLVPACGKCNQSKGNKEWKAWMLSSARLSPTARNKADVSSRIARLESFERWSKPTCMDFAAIVGEAVWARHWGNCDSIQAAMKDAQKYADGIKQSVARSYQEKTHRI